MKIGSAICLMDIITLLKDKTNLISSDNTVKITNNDMYGLERIYFYIDKNKLILANDINDIDEDLVLDEEGINLYLQTAVGMVINNKTFFKNLYMLRCGETATFSLKDNSIVFNITQSKLFKPSNSNNNDPNYYISEFSNILDQLALHLKKYAGDRTIILSLSGGYDSVLLLHLLNRHNIPYITFSYGNVNNFEIPLSQSLAKAYDKEHITLYYYDDYLHDISRSESFKQFLLWGHEGCVQPETAMFPAGCYIKTHFNTDDYLVVGGFGGDFLAGKFDFHKAYNNPFVYIREKRFLNDNIMNCIDFDCLGTTNFEKYLNWELKEYQSKMRTNELKPLSFLGIDYYCPFFNDDYYMFWSTIPISFMENRYFYKYYINNFTDDIIKQATNVYEKIMILLKTSASKNVTAFRETRYNDFYVNLTEIYKAFGNNIFSDDFMRTIMDVNYYAACKFIDFWLTYNKGDNLCKTLN